MWVHKQVCQANITVSKDQKFFPHGKNGSVKDLTQFPCNGKIIPQPIFFTDNTNLAHVAYIESVVSEIYVTILPGFVCVCVCFFYLLVLPPQKAKILLACFFFPRESCRTFVRTISFGKIVDLLRSNTLLCINFFAFNLLNFTYKYRQPRTYNKVNIHWGIRVNGVEVIIHLKRLRSSPPDVFLCIRCNICIIIHVYRPAVIHTYKPTIIQNMRLL